MVYCSKCGKQMDDSATFCSGCGAPLQNQINYAVPDINKVRKPGFGVAPTLSVSYSSHSPYAGKGVILEL